MPERVALVTGATSGMGTAIARRLARDWRVIVSARDAGALAGLCDDTGAGAIAADLSVPGAAAALGRDAGALAGRIDGIVHVAGGLEPTDMDDPASVEASVASMTRLHVAAPMALVSACLPFMGEGGAVVTVGSVNAMRAPPGAAAYAASKAALEGATRAMARDLGPRGIRVNALSPGLVMREPDNRPQAMLDKMISMTPLGRAGRPEDIAGPVAFLLSEDAAFVTAEVLVVAGGFGR